MSSWHDENITPSGAYPKYFIIPRSTVFCSQPVSHLSSHSQPWCTQFSAYPQLQDNQRMDSQLPDFSPYQSATSRSPASRSTAFWSTTYRSTASKSCFNVKRTWPPNASWNSLNISLQVHFQAHLILASKSITNLAWLWSPSTSQSSHGCSVWKLWSPHGS
jgi:hypothetical protein